MHVFVVFLMKLSLINSISLEVKLVSASSELKIAFKYMNIIYLLIFEFWSLSARSFVLFRLFL